MRISLIAAMAANRVIGRDNQLPWHLPEDLRRFKRLTMGHPMIMGRRTFDSIGRRPLPGRPTIVITRQEGYAAPGVTVAHSVDEALAKAQGEEVFVAGGEEIFREAMGRAGRLYLTVIHAEMPGDTRFPEFDEREWRVVEREDREPSGKVPFAYSFITYDRDQGSR